MTGRHPLKRIVQESASSDHCFSNPDTSADVHSQAVRSRSLVPRPTKTIRGHYRRSSDRTSNSECGFALRFCPCGLVSITMILGNQTNDYFRPNRKRDIVTGFARTYCYPAWHKSLDNFGCAETGCQTRLTQVNFEN